MPLQKTRVQVNLLGETFTVKGHVAEAEIQEAAAYLNERVEDLQSRCPLLNQKNLAILTSFNLASELLRLKKDYELLTEILDKE